MTSAANHNDSTGSNGDGADRKTVVRLLNGALATEIVCVLRYQRHHFTARRLQAQTVARKLLAYANEEQRHAELIAARITQLGGTVVFSPDGLLTFDHSANAEAKGLIEMIREDLASELLCIEAYREMIRDFGNDDPTSRHLLENILANEEQHAGDLMALIDILRREEQSRFVADRPRRVDASIDYFGTGDASRKITSDTCGEVLLEGDGVSDVRNDRRGKQEAHGMPGRHGSVRPQGGRDGQHGEGGEQQDQ